MPWLIAVLGALLVILLTRSFVLNAVALKRDINKRFDDFRVRLEREANSTIDSFLEANGGDGPK